MVDVDTIDNLPNPRRPMLAAVSTQTIAEHAAAEGLAVSRSSPRDPAGAAEASHAAVKAVADRVLPSSERDGSPDAWYRRGVRDGILCAWEGRSHRPPDDVPISDLELYVTGWAHASTVVLRVKSEGVRHGR
jgi:hypothetical protein